MNEDITPESAVIERMLHDRIPLTPSPALRSRVLDAVAREKEKQVPRVECGKHWGAGAFVIATALSLLIVAAVSLDGGSQRSVEAAGQPLLSFARRAEAAGVTLDMAAAPAVSASGRDARAEDRPQPYDTLGTIRSRLALQGEF